MMPSCWRRPWTPLWSNDRSPPRMNPNTCAWTKGMTILQAVGLPPDTAIRRTSDASVRRSWTPLARSGIRRAGGLWNGRWHGSPSAVRFWFATTRRRRTTSECFSSHVRSCGSVGSGASPFWGGHHTWFDHVLKEPFPRQRDGYYDLPTAPGIGIELDEDALLRYPHDPIPATEGYGKRRRIASRQGNLRP